MQTLRHSQPRVLLRAPMRVRMRGLGPRRNAVAVQTYHRPLRLWAAVRIPRGRIDRSVAETVSALASPRPNAAEQRLLLQVQEQHDRSIEKVATQYNMWQHSTAICSQAYSAAQHSTHAHAAPLQPRKPFR